MKHLPAKIFRNLKEETGQMPEKVNSNIPDYKAIADHQEVKTTMKEYLDSMLGLQSDYLNLAITAKIMPRITKPIIA
jgi:hypothetical protein